MSGSGICTCWWFCILFSIGCVCQFGSFFVMYMVFLVRWYVARCFFHGLASLRGKKPPWWAVRLVSCGIGAALHVSSMVCEIFLFMMSNDSHAFCHWLFVRWSWLSRRLVKVLICIEFSSKKLILNFSRFSGGIGFRILVCIMLLRSMGLASNVLCGICKVIG